MPLLSKQESEEVVTHPTYDVYLGGNSSAAESWRIDASTILRQEYPLPHQTQVESDKPCIFLSTGNTDFPTLILR